MTKEMTDGLGEAFKTGRVYDFIAKNNWRMTKDELKDILLEILDAETHGMNDEEAADQLAPALDGIKGNASIFED